MSTTLAFNVNLQLETQVCRVCAVVFAAPEQFWKERRREHNTAFYCPNGHGSVFAGETSEQKLARQLKESQKSADDLRGKVIAAEFSARTLRGQLARSRKRAAAGVCPCCKRTFKQLAAHMGTKHPGYATQEIG